MFLTRRKAERKRLLEGGEVAPEELVEPLQVFEQYSWCNRHLEFERSLQRHICYISVCRIENIIRILQQEEPSQDLDSITSITGLPGFEVKH